MSSEKFIALKKIEFSESRGDFILVYSVVLELDKRSRQLFEGEYSKYDLPTLQNLINVLKDSLDATYLSTKKENFSVLTNKSTHSSNQSRSHNNWTLNPKHLLLVLTKLAYKAKVADMKTIFMVYNQNHMI